MREIKFRAWEEANAKMRDWEYMKSISVYPGHPEWEWSQFTGLKNKKGQSMYEGDVIKHLYWNDNRAGALCTGVIRWNDESAYFQVEWITGNPYGATDLLEDVLDNEIIGNIYENPELGEFK